MRDRFLFVLAPRLAAASAVLALLVQGWRIARARNRIESESDAEYWRARGVAAAVWRLSIGLVTAGHVIAIASPGTMLVTLLLFLVITCILVVSLPQPQAAARRTTEREGSSP